MLSKLNPIEHSFIYQIQKMMLSNPLSELSEENVAAALFMSKRTLARRLALDGTSFRKIRDSILSKQASNYLLDSELSVDAIATLLNYHDSANFRRAFKRWFNMSPSAYHLKIKK
ncbi:helix-turn-helix transcriptional regulator [Acinetobacter sp. ANC 4282]|nr:AraC family transcriptional regulator [Acinetobacter terrae]NNH17359.1 helix-turn-helix transcriptional regulator [Acinetobacter terrae]